MQFFILFYSGKQTAESAESAERTAYCAYCAGYANDSDQSERRADYTAYKAGRRNACLPRSRCFTAFDSENDTENSQNKRYISHVWDKCTDNAEDAAYKRCY